MRDLFLQDKTMASHLVDKIITVFSQHIWPHHTLSRLMHFLTRVTWAPWKNWQMRWFIKTYNVNMDEPVQSDYLQFRNFNEFFTRALKADVRPIDPAADVLISPVDGRVSQIGQIVDGQLYQAKGTTFSLETLLGGEPARAAPFRKGSFATLYLSPRDYHRIHMPMDGRLTHMIYVPGKLFSVGPRTTRTVPGLFARNERVVALFETAHGPLAVVLVGALFVASIETTWAGVITPRERRGVEVWDYTAQHQPKIFLRKGDELGRFNMGSTVILALGPGALHWEPAIEAETALRMGQCLGQLTAIQPR